MIRCVFISDTHSRHPKMQIPYSDILIHCGDITMSGDLDQLESAAEFYKALPHKHKVFVAGNHDKGFDYYPVAARKIFEDAGLIYLQDSEVTLDGLRIYGSPMSPTFGYWSFMADRGESIKRYWDAIPSGLDILITHGPPFGYLDRLKHEELYVGCQDLLNAVLATKPKYHAFGHIHVNGGSIMKNDDSVFINASVCQENYQPENPITVVDFSVQI